MRMRTRIVRLPRPGESHVKKLRSEVVVCSDSRKEISLSRSTNVMTKSGVLTEAKKILKRRRDTNTTYHLIIAFAFERRKRISLWDCVVRSMSCQFPSFSFHGGNTRVARH
jgi:hypothetical protein